MGWSGPRSRRGQIENLPHSQLVYGYATSAQKTNNSLTRTLTCLCYNFITNIVEGKKKNPLLYKKSNQNRTNSVNLYLNKKNHTYENHIGHFDLGFLEKNHSKNFFCSPNQKKINPILFFPPMRSQNHMKKAQRHHDYLSSE